MFDVALLHAHLIYSPTARYSPSMTWHVFIPETFGNADVQLDWKGLADEHLNADGFHISVPLHVNVHLRGSERCLAPQNSRSRLPLAHPSNTICNLCSFLLVYVIHHNTYLEIGKPCLFPNFHGQCLWLSDLSVLEEVTQTTNFDLTAPISICGPL